MPVFVYFHLANFVIYRNVNTGNTDRKLLANIFWL